MAATFRNILRWRKQDPISAPAFAKPRVSARGTSSARIEWDQAVVLSVARGIEPDADKVLAWFSGDPIQELGGKTARQLIDEGITAPLLDMLVMIRSGRRGD
ncbi:hypothetical protein [Dyella sp.]|uniref:hypothetical protein n=1 Tax=Dyella sp. TaxID=1869338 RepID=UPI002ED5FA62